MSRILIICLLSLALTSCATSMSDTAAYQRPAALPSATAGSSISIHTTSIPFERLTGTVDVAQDQGAVDVVVTLTRLDPEQAYEMSVGPAMFDVNNTQVVIGTARGETMFIPDTTGQLQLRSRHPARIVRDGRVVVHRASPEFTVIGQSAIIPVR